MLVLMALALEQASVKAKDKEADNRVVCHTEEITGTLAGHRRVCRTAAEWRQQSENAIARSTEVVDQGLIHSAAPQ